MSEDTRTGTRSGTTSFALVDSDGILIRSEFACVRVRLRDPGGRPRLRVEDVRTGQTIELDAIELESLAWARHHDLAPLLDPSRIRWVSEDAEPPYSTRDFTGKDTDNDRNGITHPEMDLPGVWRHL